MVRLFLLVNTRYIITNQNLNLPAFRVSLQYLLLGIPVQGFHSNGPRKIVIFDSSNYTPLMLLFTNIKKQPDLTAAEHNSRKYIMLVSIVHVGHSPDC